MNRRERRWGRMYLLPLLLALTGLALLPLDWVLHLEGFDEFNELKSVMLHNCAIVGYPIVLLFLYAFRIPPKTARVFSFVSLALALFQLVVIIYCMKRPATAFTTWVPGYALMAHIQALKLVRSAQNILLTAADVCFVLSNLSAVFTCLVYATVKTRSDVRNAEFDRRNAFVARRYAKEAIEETNAPAITDEPTQIIPAQNIH